MSAPAHKYFLDKTYTGGAIKPLPSFQWDRSLPAELRYPYDLIGAALSQVRARGLHFYFTKDAYTLPEYGRNVVSVLLQEERCKVPVYGRHVRATIRNLRSRPFLGFRPRLRLGRLDALLAFEYARDWYTHLKSVRAQYRARLSMGEAIRSDPLVIHLPLGYHSQDEVAQVPMRDRPLDVFFAGQIKHEISRNDYRYWTSTSKFVAREQLWNELQRLEKKRLWNFDLGRIASTQNLTHATAFNSYSEKMMHTRICVAPRGSVAETYRAYEGLRAGCLVVANRLPDDFHLAESPILQIDHWRELEGILDKYARRLDLLENAREASLSWWHEHLSIGVRGAHLAGELNAAAETMYPI